MSLASQNALARLFGLVADDQPDTGHQFIDGVPFAATEQPPPEDDTPPDFDGGVREPEPAPAEPEKEHGQLVNRLLGPTP